MSLATKLPLVVFLASTPFAVAASVLRVCADPNNLPYSNDRKEGFENQVADLIAKDLNMQVEYFWFPQRESFFRKTLNSGVCDVVMGVPLGFDGAATTRPYYRSTYVFVTRRDRHLDIRSLDDPRLHTLRVGVHVLAEQADSLPPIYALTTRGITRNLVGYSIFGNLNEEDPPADLLKAVADSEVDVAIAWGPLAGYFAKQSSVPLVIAPISSDSLNPALRFSYSIAVGVRKDDDGLKQQLDDELVRRREAIDKILIAYGIPQVPATQEKGD